MAKTFIAYIHLAAKINKIRFGRDQWHSSGEHGTMNTNIVSVLGTFVIVSDIMHGNGRMLCLIEKPKTFHRFVQLECSVMRARMKNRKYLSNSLRIDAVE